MQYWNLQNLSTYLEKPTKHTARLWTPKIHQLIPLT